MRVINVSIPFHLLLLLVAIAVITAGIEHRLLKTRAMVFCNILLPPSDWEEEENL